MPLPHVVLGTDPENVTQQIYICRCGATAKPKDKRRFLERHPAKCDVQKILNQRLGKVKPAYVSQEEDVHMYRLQRIEAEGRNLTDWEKVFIKDIRAKVNSVGTALLTENQKWHLETVYCDRTP